MENGISHDQLSLLMDILGGFTCEDYGEMANYHWPTVRSFVKTAYDYILPEDHERFREAVATSVGGV